MKLQKLLLRALCVSGSVWVVAMTATAQKVQARQVNDGQVSSGKIPYLNEVELANKSAYQLVQSPAPGTVTITGVKANPTDKGLEIILETTQADKLQVTNRSTGNNFIADVAGGQLRLPSGEAFTFRSEKPLAGITEITVTNVDTNTVRVTVVGEKALPTVELFDDDNVGLVFGVAPATTATQPPQQEAPQTTEKPATEAPHSNQSAERSMK